jgi:hypothetical protein
LVSLVPAWHMYRVNIQHQQRYHRLPCQQPHGQLHAERVHEDDGELMGGWLRPKGKKAQRCMEP